MVFEETITIECFLGGLTIAINGFTMVFDVATIAFNGFRWFRTIGQTMRWFRWIVVVYPVLFVSDLSDENCRSDFDPLRGHSGDFGNTAKMVGKMSKSVLQLSLIRF